MRTSLLFVATLSLVACVTEDDGVVDVAQELAGTPDELAMVRFLNDPLTTATLLDDQVPLDRRAADNLIAHRDGADRRFGTADDDRFDTAAEVDDVKYVGVTALDALVAFARAGAWVQDDELFGTFDGVAFDVASARAAVDLANDATEASLKADVKLDTRAAHNVVLARPIDNMEELAAVAYVGPAMMGRIHAFVAAPASCSDATLLTELRGAADGMWLTSESDYPVEAVSWAGQAAAGGSASDFVRLLGLPAGTPVRVSTLDHMIERLGYSNEEPKVAALRALLAAKLSQIVVYEVGTIQVHDYIVGRTACGGLAGVTSISIET